MSPGQTGGWGQRPHCAAQRQEVEVPSSLALSYPLVAGRHASLRLRGGETHYPISCHSLVGDAKHLGLLPGAAEPGKHLGTG